MAKIILRVETVEEEDYYTYQTLYANEQEIASVGDLSECPEDAIIGRDLVDCKDIAYWIMYGYDAAKRGYELIFE